VLIYFMASKLSGSMMSLSNMSILLRHLSWGKSTAMAFWRASWLELEPYFMQFMSPDPDKGGGPITIDFWANYLVASCDSKTTEEGKKKF
jgi:hypothetical protein